MGALGAWVPPGHFAFPLARGEWQRAIELFTQALQRAPKELSAYIGLARALLASGDIQRALEAIRDALNLAPNDPGANELMRELIGG